MDFWTQHLTEVLIGIEIMITVYLLKSVQALSNKQAVMEEKVRHINKAVNNADPDEKTLRQLVLDLDRRTRERYK